MPSDLLDAWLSLALLPELGTPGLHAVQQYDPPTLARSLALAEAIVGVRDTRERKAAAEAAHAAACRKYL